MRVIPGMIPYFHQAQLVLPLIPFLTYVLCTCTHRRNVLFSKVALMSALASIAGFIVGGALALPFVATGIQAFVDIIMSFFLFIFPFFTCRYFCARERRKEWERLNDPDREFFIAPPAGRGR